MRLNSGQALYVILGNTAYYSNEHYQESAENKGRNPICLIFHFQTIVDPRLLSCLFKQERDQIEI